MRRPRPVTVVLALISLWVGWFGLTIWFRHLNLISSHFDLGIMDQVMWQTIHGHVFQMTSPVFGILQSRFAIHGDLLLLAYTPFYALWQDPRTLMLLQLAAVATAALPIFWLARRQVADRWAVGLAALYLLQPVLQWSVVFDVHAIVLATPLLLWGTWAAVTKRTYLPWIMFGAALLAKEEVGIVVAVTALILGWQRTISRRAAWTLGLIALGWVGLMTSVIIPHFAGNSSHFAIAYFSEYGRTVPEIFIGLFRHPIILWHDLVNIEGLGYLVIVLGSVAWLPLWRPRWLLPALPIVVMNLISNDPNMQSVYFQYTATITPFVILAAIDGLSSLQTYPPRLVIAWSAIWIGVIVWLWSPLPGMRHHHDAVQVFTAHPYGPIVRTLAETIPTDVALAVSNDLGPHFSRRERIWVFPFALERADAAVVLLQQEHDVLPQSQLHSALENLKNNPQWKIESVWNNELFYLRRIN